MKELRFLGIKLLELNAVAEGGGTSDGGTAGFASIEWLSVLVREILGSVKFGSDINVIITNRPRIVNQLQILEPFERSKYSQIYSTTADIKNSSFMSLVLRSAPVILPFPSNT